MKRRKSYSIGHKNNIRVFLYYHCGHSSQQQWLYSVGHRSHAQSNGFQCLAFEPNKSAGFSIICVVQMQQSFRNFGFISCVFIPQRMTCAEAAILNKLKAMTKKYMCCIYITRLRSPVATRAGKAISRHSGVELNQDAQSASIA